MFKISPFTPLFFNSSSDRFGAESKYVQLFAPTDSLFIEILVRDQIDMSGVILDKVSGEKTPLVFQSFFMSDKNCVVYTTITGLPNSYYSVFINEQESDIFKVTDCEQELSETTLIRYSMRNNKLRNDCVFWNGENQFFFEFRAPGGFKDNDWTFAVNNEQFEIGNGNIVELFAIESTQKQFTLGNAKGCPVWYAEHLNRILCCSNVSFNGTRFVRKGNSTPEMTQEIPDLKSYVFKVSLQGMVDNIDFDFPAPEEPGGPEEPEGGGEGYIYLIKLNDKVIPTDRNTFSSLRILAEINRAIEANNGTLLKKFISRENDDDAEGLITFLKGLVSEDYIKAKTDITIGESIIDSLIAGMGIILKNGRIQADRMELRSSLVVLRLIANEIQSMSGDYSFSDCGCIEKIEKLDATTYKLWMEKRTDTDWTNLDVNDVLFSIVNSLLLGGTDYYTSWFRCLAKNRNDNTLTVVLYPDSEVPGGKNFPPAEGYNVTRRGNAIIPDAGNINDRAQSWMISSREGRIMFLQNVFKPILEESNYSLTIGKFPKLKALEKLPLSDSDTGIYAKNIVAENFYQIDYNGDIIPSKVDRGNWSLAVAQSTSPYRNVTHDQLTESGSTYTLLEQHTVYHYGCKWGCLIDKTTLEPLWNSPGWILLEGNKEYTLSFDSTQGWQFFRTNVNTDITVTVNYSNRDITNLLMATTGVQVEWLRDTSNTPADNSWKPNYVDNQKHVIHLSLADMGSEWGLSARKVIFTCRVFIPVGDKLEKLEKSIRFKI